MANLGTVALKVAKQLGRVDKSGTSIIDLETEIKEEIGEAIKFHNRQPWALTEVRGMSLSTVNGQAWYSTLDVSTGSGEQDTTGRTSVSASDIISFSYVRQDDWDLDATAYAAFEQYSEGVPSTGDPTRYTRYAGQIGFWPTPDAVYQIEVSGTVKPVVPTSDLDTSIWFDRAEELIVSGAVKRVCLKYTRDEELARVHIALESDAMDQLRSESLKQTASRRIRAHS